MPKGIAPQPNISHGKTKAIKELREDKSRVILTVDKGVAVVVIDKKDYLGKTQDLIVDRNTCKPISGPHQQVTTFCCLLSHGQMASRVVYSTSGYIINGRNYICDM